MLKTLRSIMKQNKDTRKIPRSIQKTIPIDTIYEDGIFKYGNLYSKTYVFDDINYAVASKEDKENMFLTYSELLNSFDPGATYKITINVCKIDEEEFKKSILIPMRFDKLDIYRGWQENPIFKQNNCINKNSI